MAQQGNMSLMEFMERYGTIEACREHLYQMRWGQGFVCPKCGVKDEPFQTKSEMEDIELLVNSNAKNISSYSNCATKSGDKFDYLRTIYSPLHDKDALPEQILIDKLYKHYSSPKFRYSNNLNRGFSILSRIYENSIKKEMVVDQISIDYANESSNASLIET